MFFSNYRWMNPTLRKSKQHCARRIKMFSGTGASMTTFWTFMGKLYCLSTCIYSSWCVANFAIISYSNVIVERAQLLMAIVQKKQINSGNVIYDQMQKVFKLSRDLWFLALISMLYHMGRVQERMTKEIMKRGLPISIRTTETHWDNSMGGKIKPLLLTLPPMLRKNLWKRWNIPS